MPVPYVCHLVFLELYKRDIKTAIAFFVESDLFSFLLNRRGEFDLVPKVGGEQIVFKDGATISPEGSTWTWEQFFRIFYMEYVKDHRQFLEDQIADRLDAESLVVDLDASADV
ncbi:hypothetical protein CCY01nite_07730 [Chitinophaga cymbidii]|uniref:Uncharacterized protein n=2 Tax=Chitinophaga cymbidii TaxID=1096750 RepID=A0A512RFM7_9BACT|nr:hypothetical protein CCY01nite_07730 [Chitinophaga cymbidii]